MSAGIIDVPAARAAATIEERTATQYLEALEALEVATHDDLAFAVEATAEVKTRAAEVDAARRRFIEPAMRIVDEAKALFDAPLELLRRSEAIIKARMSDYIVSRETRRRELLERAAELSRSGETMLAEATIAEADAVDGEPIAGLAVRRAVAVEVVDRDALLAWALAEAPELVTVDPKGLKSLAKTRRDIPGCVVAESTSLAITPARVKKL